LTETIDDVERTWLF